MKNSIITNRSIYLVCDKCDQDCGVIWHNEWDSMSDIRFEEFLCEKCLEEKHIETL